MAGLRAALLALRAAMQAGAPPDVIEDLRERIRGIERSPQRLAEARKLSTGLAVLDELLPQGGLPSGTLIEWLGESEGSGAAAAALSVAAHILRQEGLFVVVDQANEFYPLAAAALGIPLERTVVVRPDTRMAALWAWEQALRCPGVAVTLGWVDAIDERLFRRLQLGVETGGGLGFLLRPPACQAAPSWASTRIGVKPVPQTCAEEERRRLQVWVARGQTGSRAAVEVELMGFC